MEHIEIVSANAIINGRPCRVIDVIYARTGRHGPLKCHFKAVDIFTGRNQEMAYNSTENAEVPIMRKN